MTPASGQRFGAVTFLVLLLGYMGFADLHRAARKPLWFDEIITVAVARQKSSADIWAAVRKSVDLQPPFFHWVEHYAASCWPDEHVGYRVLSIAAVLVAAAALFGAMRPLAGDLGGLIAALVPLATTLHSDYAIEARPYALVSACVSVAVLLWLRPRRLLGTVGLGLSVLLAASLHYYALFAILPLMIGELIRTIVRRKCDFATWAALLCGLAPPAFLWPLLSQARKLFGATFWAKPAWVELPALYDFVFAGVDLWGAALLLSVVGGLAVALIRTRPGLARLAPEIRGLIVGFLALPLIVVVATTMAGGGMHGRYVLPTIVGMALGIAYLATGLGPRIAQGTLALLVGWLAVQEVHYWIGHHSDARAADKILADSAWWRDAVTAQPGPARPIVIGDGLQFLAESYYRNFRGDAPVVFLVDSAAAIKHLQADTIERSLPILAEYMPLELRERASLGDRFFLVHDDTDWWSAQLQSLGYRLTVLAQHDRSILFQVESPPRPPR